jgi:hypothetical protein
MAFVVRRPAGRWEIRESYATEDGPRARTLASFTRLRPEVLERAEAAAWVTIDRESLIRSARRAGATFEPSAADTLAAELLHRVGRETPVRPGLRRLLVNRLSADLPVLGDDSVADWIGASTEDRGAALLDLLGLADRIPKPRRDRPLDFPGLSPERLRRP